VIQDLCLRFYRRFSGVVTSDLCLQPACTVLDTLLRPCSSPDGLELHNSSMTHSQLVLFLRLESLGLLLVDLPVIERMSVLFG
jgi:hypothetical protein